MRKDQKLTMPASNLVLGDDNLTTVGVIGSWNGVFQEANCSNNLSFLEDSDFAIFCILEIARVANDLFCPDGFAAAGHTNELTARIGHNVVDVFIEHVSTAVDSAKTSERLRKFAKPVERVNVG